MGVGRTDEAPPDCEVHAPIPHAVAIALTGGVVMVVVMNLEALAGVTW